MVPESDPGSARKLPKQAPAAAAAADPAAVPESRPGTSAAPQEQFPAGAIAAHTSASAAPPKTNRRAVPAARAKGSAAAHPGQPGRRSARKWWIGAIAALLLAGYWFQLRPARRGSAAPLEGYVTDTAVLENEYARYYGKVLSNSELETQFNNAAAMMLRHEYAKAAALLEATARQAALPVVFNDLGVLYAELNDRGRAVFAFRESLARDGSYVPARNNFVRYKSLISDTADPLTREIEPNDTTPLSNLIALDKPVEAEIAAATRDADIFRFSAPPAPRDILALEFSNRSAALIPVVRLYDSDDRTIDLGEPGTAAGASFTRYFSPAPNSTLFLRVSSGRDTAGTYFLTIKPLKAYDAYEPNDDIFSSHSIVIGEPVEANIMDAQDTDYYSFVAPRTGPVAIELRNRSTTLIPALTTFHPDRRNSGFGPDLRTPGADLRYRLEVQENQTYYLQVWSQSNSSGKYTLTVN
jgi:hypothetical protein